MREQQRVTEPSANLWRNGAFLRLWFAQVVSNAGSAITGYALPLTAILVLGAGPAQMALLRGADFVPHLLFGLFAGVWIDRARRQPILVGADLGRAVLLATIPLATLLGVVSFPQLWVVVFAVSTLTACSSLAAVSLLPRIVPPRQLVAANSRLATTDAVLAIAMPSAASGVVQLVGAPRAVLADALSYLVSAFTLRRLRVAETADSARLTRAIVGREIVEGLRELVRTPALRALTIAVSVGTFGTAMQSTVSFLFLLNELHLTPLLHRRPRYVRRGGRDRRRGLRGARESAPRDRSDDHHRESALGGGRAHGPARAARGDANRARRRHVRRQCWRGDLER